MRIMRYASFGTFRPMCHTKKLARIPYPNTAVAPGCCVCAVTSPERLKYCNTLVQIPAVCL